MKMNGVEFESLIERRVVKKGNKKIVYDFEWSEYSKRLQIFENGTRVANEYVDNAEGFKKYIAAYMDGK
jgi:hypothetical protein